MIRTCVAVVAALASSTLLVTPPAGAADTGKIVYASGGHVYLMDPDGTHQVDLTPGWTDVATDPHLSPDGTRVVLATNPAQSTAELYLIPTAPTAETEATRLTSDSLFDGDPVWSPDGTRIAWTHDTPSTDVALNYEIWTMGADGTDPQRVTDDATGAFDFEPTWSPDGSQIAWATTRDGYTCTTSGGAQHLIDQIHVMPAAGGADTNLTSDPTKDATSPDWSPDGATIAFTETDWPLGPDTGTGATCAAADDQVSVQPAAGGSATALHAGYAPSWSPEGSRLVLDGPGGTLAEMDAAGSSYTDLAVPGGFADWGTVTTPTTTPPAATTTTVAVTKHRRRVDAAGAVSPPVPGQSVTVTLARRSHHRFRTVASHTAVLDASSHYQATFTRARRGTCRIVARYAGDATHAASSGTVRFRC